MLQSGFSDVVRDLRKIICFRSVLSISMRQPLSNIITGSCWKQLQHHKQRRLTLARKTWQEQRKLGKSSATHQNLRVLNAVGLYAPFLFNSTSFGQHLVRFFLLEIILLRGMRSYCWYRKAVETSLGFGYWCCTFAFFTAGKEIIASYFIQNRAGWPDLEQSRRCWCRYSVPCCLAQHLWPVVGFSQLFLMFALGMSYKTTRTQSEEQPNSSCSPQCSPLLYVCQPLLWAHPTFPVKQRLDPVSKSKLPSHPCCTELQGDLLAPKAPYPLPITQQSPDISAQKCCLDQEQGGVPWPHFL